MQAAACRVPPASGLDRIGQAAGAWAASVAASRRRSSLSKFQAFRILQSEREIDCGVDSLRQLDKRVGAAAEADDATEGRQAAGAGMHTQGQTSQRDVQ